MDPIRAALASAKEVFVPLCFEGNLRLFRLRSLDDLAPRTLGILEPREDLWTPDRFISVDAIDVALIPGLAFGRDGSRVGQGRGYYDRLLAPAVGRPLRVAVAFECQLFDRVPSTPSDALMDLIVTESAEYRRAPPRALAAGIERC
jgi:5-formyltetrahydrofolate cyclo-ligase